MFNWSPGICKILFLTLTEVRGSRAPTYSPATQSSRKVRPPTGVYKVPYCWGRISSCEERKGISCLWGRITWKKGKRKQGYNIKAVGKNVKWGRGEGDGNFGEENQD